MILANPHSTMESNEANNEIPQKTDSEFFDMKSILTTLSVLQNKKTKRHYFLNGLMVKWNTPRLIYMSIALVLLAVGTALSIFGCHKLSILFIFLTIISYCYSIRPSWKSDPLKDLALQSGDEKKLLIKLKKRFSDKHLNAVRYRVKTLRKCIEIRSEFMQMMPDLLVAGGALIAAMNQIDLAEVVNTSIAEKLKVGILCGATAFGIIMKIIASVSLSELASIREAEYYLDAATRSSSP